jgi:hypothetical protein
MNILPQLSAALAGCRRAFVVATVVSGLPLYGQADATKHPVAGQVQQTAVPLAIRDVTVIDVAAGQRLARQTVIVERGRIAHLGPVATTPIARTARIATGRLSRAEAAKRFSDARCARELLGSLAA